MKIMSYISRGEGNTEYVSLEKVKHREVFFLRSTGVSMATNLKTFFIRVGGRSPKKGCKQIIDLGTGKIWLVAKDCSVCVVRAELVIFNK